MGNSQDENDAGTCDSTEIELVGCQTRRPSSFLFYLAPRAFSEYLFGTRHFLGKIKSITLPTTPLRTRRPKIQTSLSLIELLREDPTMRAPGRAIALQLRRLELHTLTRTIPQQAQNHRDEPSLLIHRILLRGVCSTESRIEGAGERLLAQTIPGLVVQFAGAVLRVLPFRRRWRRSSRGFVAVGADDYDLEVVAGLVGVGGGFLRNAGSLDAAFVVGHGSWVGARALIRVPRWIALYTLKPVQKEVAPQKLAQPSIS
jgi:hypothetical protein